MKMSVAVKTSISSPYRKCSGEGGGGEGGEGVESCPTVGRDGQLGTWLKLSRFPRISTAKKLTQPSYLILILFS